MITQNGQFPSRRDALSEAAALAMSGAIATLTSQAKAATSAPKVQFPPAGTTDCRVHVFDSGRFHYAEPRTYTPGTASVGDLQSFQRGLGVDRLVLVQPSVYGDDNRCLLDALRELGRDVSRGIAVVDPARIGDADLRALAQSGVVGVRVNLNVKGEDRATAAVAAVARAMSCVAGTGLAVQIYVDLPLVEPLADTIATTRVPVILDHFAGARAALGPEQPGFATLLRLFDTGKVWIKLSAGYRASQRAPDYEDVAALARTLISARIRSADLGVGLASHRWWLGATRAQAGRYRTVPADRRCAPVVAALVMDGRSERRSQDPRRQSSTPVRLLKSPLG